MRKPLSLADKSDQFSVIDVSFMAENIKLAGAVGIGGVKPYLFPVTGLEVMFASVVELALVPELLTDKKLPEPVEAAVMPIEPEAAYVEPDSRRYMYSTLPVPSYRFT